MIGSSRFIGMLDQIGAGPFGGVVTTAGLVVAMVVVTPVAGKPVSSGVNFAVTPETSLVPDVSEGSVPDLLMSTPVMFVVGTVVVATGAM